MATITRIEVFVNNGESGTNGKVYLGLGGREFLLDRPNHNDFRRNTNDQFVLGNANNVQSVANPARNDPQALMPIDSADLDRFPAYIRLEAGTTWHLEEVRVTATSPEGNRVLSALPGAQNLFLGDAFGKIVYLR